MSGKLPHSRRKMPKTRQQREEALAKRRAREATYQAQLSPEKKRAQLLRRAEKSPKVAKIDRDRAAAQCSLLAQLKRKAVGTNEGIKELRRAKDEIAKKYVLNADEPSIDDAKSKAAEDAFERALKTPGVLQKLTNETPEDFEELWLVVKEPLAKINLPRRIRKRSAGQRQHLPDRVQLFITLFFLRQYLTYAALSFSLGGLSELSLHHYIFRVLTALSAVPSLRIEWPSDDEMKEHVKKPLNFPFKDKENIVAATDGTELKIAYPSKNAIRNKHFSAKKKQYALNVLLVVLLSGVIIFCSDPLPNLNDQSFFNSSGVRSKFCGKPWGLIADSGFTLNSAEAVAGEGRIIGLTPYKRPRGTKQATTVMKKHAKSSAKGSNAVEKDWEDVGKVKRKRSKKEPNLIEEELLDVGHAPTPAPIVPKLTDEQKTRNVELSHMRVVVENTNARLKTYKVIGSKLRHYRPGADRPAAKNITPALIMKVVAGLTNLHIKKNPCRSKEWVPEKVGEEDLASMEGSDCEHSDIGEFDADE